VHHVAEDGRVEVEGQRPGGEQVDQHSPAAELDKGRNQQQGKAVEQRCAVGNVGVWVRQSLLRGIHLAELQNPQQQRPEEHQRRRQQHDLRIVSQDHLP
jgi:hypothetical protein